MNSIIYLMAHIIVTLGIYNIIETFFVKNRENSKLKYILYSGYYIVTSMTMIFLKNPNINTIINIVCIFIITQSYKGTQVKKILVTLIVYTTIMVVDGAIYSTVMAMSVFDGGINPLVTSIGIYLYSLLIKSMCREYMRLNRENYAQYILLLIIPFSSIIILNLILNAENSKLIISAISFVLLIINGTSYIVLYYITKLQESAHRSEIIALQKESEQIQVEATKKLELEVRSIRHDIRNHIYIISEMVKSKEYQYLEEYAEELVEKVEEKALFINTGRFDIDSIVNAKLTKAKNLGALIEVDTFACDKIEISSFDLTTILANILDNAVESLERSQNKKLKFVMGYDLGCVRIKLENTVKDKVNIVDGKVKTAKNDKKEHGYGLENVRNIAYKYNGSVDIDNEEGRFIIDISLFP